MPIGKSKRGSVGGLSLALWAVRLRLAPLIPRISPSAGSRLRKCGVQGLRKCGGQARQILACGARKDTELVRRPFSAVLEIKTGIQTSCGVLAWVLAPRTPLKYVWLGFANGDPKTPKVLVFGLLCILLEKRRVLLLPLGQHPRQGSVFSTIGRPLYPFASGVLRHLRYPASQSNQNS